MIDMRNLHIHSDYIIALANFNSRVNISYCDDNDWKKVRDVHLVVSKDRCPICECKLDNSVSRKSKSGRTTIKPQIDHYRPQKYYPSLKCDDKNYLIMCSDCNNCYKGNLFPVDISSPNGDLSLSINDNIKNEKPLIINPIYDNLLELFILVFILTPSGKKVLELEPKETTGYLHEKAKETIRLFSLGNCEVDVHPSANVRNCRIELLHDHFNKFYGLIQALKQKDKEKAINEIKTKELDKYGFYNFIKAKQFKILVP